MIRAVVLATLLSLVAVGPEARAQEDPENPPEPPVERLAELKPFFGLYTHSDQTFGELDPWAGTLEVGPAVKGWYVEWVINTHHEAIDRQNRLIMTWDEGLGRYRVWRFNTLPAQPPGSVEGEAHFMGDTLVMVWEDMRGPGSRRGEFRNRAFMDGPDELVIISDFLPRGATDRIRLLEMRNRRRM